MSDITFPKLEEAEGKLDHVRKELADVLTESGPEYDPKKVKSQSFADGHAFAEWVRAKNAELADLKKSRDDLADVFKAAQAAKEDPTKGEVPGGEAIKTRRTKSFGEQFVASDAFKAYRSGSGRGPVSTVDMDLKALFQTGDGWAPESTRTGIFTAFPTRPAPHVVDSIPQLPTGMAVVKYMEETTFTNAAAETAESTQATPGTYPEATLKVEEKSQIVRKIAVFLPVTDEQVEDEPGAQAYVEQRLGFMCRQRLDSQVLVGNGTAPNLLGTENVTGIQTQALGADNIPDAIYKAMTKIRDDGFAEPSVVFIRPSKWENVRLLKTADGAYVWGHPALPGPETIWGVPVVQTTAVTATKAVLGDYANHAALFNRRGIDIQISNSHGSFFIEGKLAIRADLRVAMVHLRPKAFAEVTGLP